MRRESKSSLMGPSVSSVSCVCAPRRRSGAIHGEDKARVEGHGALGGDALLDEDSGRRVAAPAAARLARLLHR
jgi:hypothetical protein